MIRTDEILPGLQWMDIGTEIVLYSEASLLSQVPQHFRVAEIAPGVYPISGGAWALVFISLEEWIIEHGTCWAARVLIQSGAHFEALRKYFPSIHNHIFLLDQPLESIKQTHQLRKELHDCNQKH